MIENDTRLTPELQELANSIGEVAKEAGLDFFQTIFELVDYNQLNEVAAYGGFPTRYPHWRWGMEYERLSKTYKYGLSVIYELVINTNPAYAYLMRANTMVLQKTVIAHVYAHVDFFKNNYWFSKTNRKMLDQMANHSSIIRRISNEIGVEVVEDFIDHCLTLDNLIDIHSPFKTARAAPKEDDSISKPASHPSKLQAKKYMDSYVNPKEFLDAQAEKIEQESQKQRQFPEHPERDVLGFLANHAPLESWQKRIVEIIRDEAYYFAPQGQTKILNEGWASYWHSKIMTKLHPLEDSEIVDFCDLHAGVVANHPGQLNPYRLGIELLRHVEKRWDEGKYGLEYISIDDPKVRAEWNKETGEGRDKIFEVRKLHNDITFIDEFLDEDFCHESKMFIYDHDPRTGKYIISNRNFKDIKSQLLSQLTNFGQPIIEIIDANFKNRGELLLRHQHTGADLKHDFTLEALKALHKIWNRPVHLETTAEDVPKRVSFDGSTHAVEKVSA